MFQEVLERMAQALEERGIDYMLIGGQARRVARLREVAYLS